MIAALLMTFQAVAAQPVALTDLGAPTQEAAAAAPAVPERKRVCRTQLDTRVGLIPKQRKICNYIHADQGKADRAD